MKRAALIKAGALTLVLLGAVGLALIRGTPDIAAMRSRVDAAGVWGPALFFALYLGLALIPLSQGPPHRRRRNAFRAVGRRRAFPGRRLGRGSHLLRCRETAGP